MNCKPGELAVIVRAKLPENLGRIVRLTKFNPNATFFGEPSMRGGWAYEGPELPSPIPVMRVIFIHDSFLRPIRDNPGADETLTWAGKPQPVEV